MGLILTRTASARPATRIAPTVLAQPQVTALAARRPSGTSTSLMSPSPLVSVPATLGRLSFQLVPLDIRAAIAGTASRSVPPPSVHLMTPRIVWRALLATRQASPMRASAW